MKFNKINYSIWFIVFTVCLTHATISSAQKLSFGEMINILGKNISDMEDLLVKKEFTYFNKDRTDECDRFEFAYNKSKVNNKAKSFVNIFLCGKEKTRVQFKITRPIFLICW